MENKRHSLCLALIALLMAAGAHAAEDDSDARIEAGAPAPVSRYSGGTLKELTDILARTRVKEAELHLLTIESKIRELKRRMEMEGPPPGDLAAPSVIRAGDNLVKIRFPDGRVYEAGKGAELDNGSRIADIGKDSVIIESRRGKRLIVPIMKDAK